MDWFPVVFITFKLAVLGTGMFFAVKWHYDQDEKAKKGDALKSVGKMSAIFLLSLLSLAFVTFMIAKTLNLDLALPL